MNTDTFKINAVTDFRLILWLSGKQNAAVRKMLLVKSWHYQKLFSMKAADARLLAATTDLSEIYSVIEPFAKKKGNYSMHVYNILTPSQRDELSHAGFSITDHSKADEICYEISWKI